MLIIKCSENNVCSLFYLIEKDLSREKIDYIIFALSLFEEYTQKEVQKIINLTKNLSLRELIKQSNYITRIYKNKMQFKEHLYTKI